MSIFVTGDCHGRFEKFSSDNFPQGKNLTKEDYIIILGDTGIIWDYKGKNKNEEYWLDWLNNKPWTTLFIAGNHENFDRLEEYYIENWHDGKVSFLRSSVIYLQYGEIFNIAGKKVLAVGKAASHDTRDGILDPADYKSKEELNKACSDLERKCGGWQFALYRIKGMSWWEQEIPSPAERLNAIENLKKVDNKVDFILSHEAPASDVILLGGGSFKPDEYSQFLEGLRCQTEYKKWCFGHYHLDRAINEKDVCYFKKIVQIA